MTDTNRATSIEQWTSVQAYVLAVICLLVGIAGGWFIRGSQSPAASRLRRRTHPLRLPCRSQTRAPNSGADAENGRHASWTLDREAQGRSGQSTNFWKMLGNVYYDAQLYPTAIEYYQRALKLSPPTRAFAPTWGLPIGTPATPIPPSRNSRNRFLTNRTRPTPCSILESSSGRARWISTKLRYLAEVVGHESEL
jgi:tetratricopeptide (TPR) repeat protein